MVGLGSFNLGHKHPACYLTTTALGGAFLVVSSQGLGASIVYSITNWNTDNQFLDWGFYPLMIFVIFTCLFQVNYLNKALSYFSASIVTPLNYVFFSSATIVTSSILYQGFNVDSPRTAITILLGFLIIITGVALILQYNLKVTKLSLALQHVEDFSDEANMLEVPADDSLKLLSSIFFPEPEKYSLKLVDDADPQNYVRRKGSDV
jgi:hypothetical protein